MQLQLYKNFSKKRNSTKIPQSNYVTVNVLLKQATSLDNPTFLIQGVDLEVNYCHVVNGRYYFIDDIILGNNNVYELHCSTDYLATFRNEIFNSHQYVERSASLYNTMYIDPYISVQANASRKVSATTNIGFTSSDGSYVVRVAGGDTDGVSTYIVDSLIDLGAIFNPRNYYQTSDDDFKKLIGNFIFDPYDYIVDLYWSPIPYHDIAPTSGSGNNNGYKTNIKVKWFDTGINAFKLYDNITLSKGGLVNLPANSYNDFRLHDPRFSNYKIYLPSVGVVPISFVNLQYLYVDYFISLDTGACRIMLKNSSNDTIFASYNTNIYRSIQYGSDKADMGTIIGGAFNTIGGVASGNIPLAVTGGVSVLTNAIVSTPSIAGSNSGLGLKGANLIIVELDNYGSGDIDVEHFGRPLCRNVSLFELSGYCKCAGASLDIKGFSGDKDNVNNYLNDGFYIE